VETGVTSQQTATSGERPPSERAAATADPARMVYTPEEYLARERMAEAKSEYLDGEVLAMAGASRVHNLIRVNLSRELSQQLRGRPCEAYTADMRVRVSRTGLYAYPDVVVACDEIQFEDDQVDTLLNPVVVIEVLSPKTEAYDRGEKFAHYRRLDSLQEYLLVSQDKVRVERYVRQGDQWVLTELSAPDDILQIDAIECSVRMADVYERVELPSGQTPEPDAAQGGTA
jgi:Uma2 family endonuclease